MSDSTPPPGTQCDGHRGVHVDHVGKPVVAGCDHEAVTTRINILGFTAYYCDEHAQTHDQRMEDPRD